MGPSFSWEGDQKMWKVTKEGAIYSPHTISVSAFSGRQDTTNEACPLRHFPLFLARVAFQRNHSGGFVCCVVL